MSELSPLDLRIVESLRHDGRRSIAELARELRLPRVTVHDHLTRLVRDGVIRGFSVRLDRRRFGEGTTAFVLLRFQRVPGVTQRSVAEEVARLPGVSEVHIVAGEQDLLVKVRGPSLEEIGQLIVGPLRDIPGVEHTVTFPCFATVREEA